MAFNASSPFGQPSQPAFGQAPQPPNTSYGFGAPATSASAPKGKITFGARAAAVQQPTALIGAPSQSSSAWGAAAGNSQSSPNFVASSGGLFGNAGASQPAQGFASGTPSPFWGSPPGSSLSTTGFGGSASTNAIRNGQQTGQGFGGFGGSTSTNAIGNSQPTGQGFGIFGGSAGTMAFGKSQQTGQGFGSFGAAASAAVSSSPTAARPFARLGARVTAAPAADIPSNGNANGFGTPLFGQLGQTAPPAAGISAAQSPTPTTSVHFGTQQAVPPFGFGTAPALGSNPLAAPTSGAPVQPVAFGRAAKRKQSQQQPTGVGGQQQQAQADCHRPEQQPKRTKAPAVLHKQLSKQRRAQPLSTDLADPAALAARSNRFGRPQPWAGSSQAPPASAVVPTDTDGDTDDQQGTVHSLLRIPAISA